MTLDQFVERWLGKKADYDGHYGGQCVDLFRYYVDEVLGFDQPFPVQGAKDFWYHFDTDNALNGKFTRIENTPDAIPQKGDVVIWDAWSTNEFGHVAIFLEGNVDRFTSLDQNYPTLNVVTKTSHTYLRPKVLGWLRPKGEAMEDTEIDFDDGEGKRHTVSWYVREWYGEKSANKELTEEMVKLREQANSADRRRAELEGTVSERDKQVTALTNDRNKFENELIIAVRERDTAEELNIKLEQKLKEVNDVNVSSIWDRFPREAKVAIYLLASAVISQGIIMLTGIETDNAILLMLANIGLVFLKELKPRIDSVRNK